MGRPGQQAESGCLPLLKYDTQTGRYTQIIDGSTAESGCLPLLKYDTQTGRYTQIINGREEAVSSGRTA